MKHFKIAIFFSLILLVIGGCNNYSKSETGLRYRIIKRGKEKSLPQLGEYLQCYYSIANSEDSVFVTYFGKRPDRIMLTQSTHKGGDIMDALGMMSEGDSAMFLISADSFFRKTRGEITMPSYIREGSDLKFIIKMDKRLNKRQYDSIINVEKIARWNEEIENINKYIKEKGLNMTLDTLTGLRYQFYQKSDTGTRIVEGKTAHLHAIGRLLDGTEIFNSYTNGGIQVVPVLKSNFEPIGMYEILIRMRKGEKGLFILPFDMAYGAKGINKMIPPFATLVYEVNILDVL